MNLSRGINNENKHISCGSIAAKISQVRLLMARVQAHVTDIRYQTSPNYDGERAADRYIWTQVTYLVSSVLLAREGGPGPILERRDGGFSLIYSIPSPRGWILVALHPMIHHHHHTRFHVDCV